MNPLFIIIALVIVVVVGISLYFITSKKGHSSAASPSSSSNNDNGLNVLRTVETNTGLKIEVLRDGSGEVAKVGNTVSVHYTGYLTNGTKFDSSHNRGKPFQFYLGGGKVIKGWDIGVKGMKINEQRRLIVPPNLGYGSRGAGKVIPPNATLVFIVELVAVK